MWQVIDLSWRLLTPAAQALLQTWCALPDGGKLVAAVLHSSADALDELLAHSMLQTSVCADGALQHRVGEMVRSFVTAQPLVAHRVVSNDNHNGNDNFSDVLQI
jgi:hypothetical protein